MVLSGYLLAFGTAVLACGAGAYRAAQISDRDTCYGLVSLLVLSGVWALAQIGFLTVRPPSVKVGIYLVGLIAGFATVWAWLYFCFAYAGRSLHQNRTIRRWALGLFAVVVLVKLTNPLHHFYFSTEWAAYPFAHLAVQNHVLHWVTFGLAYALSAIGIFVLFELFAGIASSTRPLVVLVGLTSLPALLNAAGHTSPMFLDVGHEPIGVAAFAVGVLFIYGDAFQDAHLTGTREAPALVLGGHGQIRSYNEEAAALFPALHADLGTNQQLDAVLPELARVRREAPSLLQLDLDGKTRYFSVCESRLGQVHTRPGRLLLLDEVTEQKEREETLRTAKETAEEASQLKSAILANMKHEVRTPLTSILSFAGILKKQVADQNERYVELVLRGGERLQETLDSVLRLSELETGSVDIHRERVNLGVVADTTVELLRPQAEDDDIMLVTDLPEAPVVGMWDEDALFRITENLLENALKFTPEGGRVDVRVRETERDAVLEIEDTGIGIREEDLDYIFEAFRQVDQGPKREYEGSGLGLSIVKKLIDALGGSIDVQSAPSQGSCFTVCLPKTPSSEAPDVAGADDPHRTNGKRA
jgi:signal transduction histidine kinase